MGKLVRRDPPSHIRYNYYFNGTRRSRVSHESVCVRRENCDAPYNNIFTRQKYHTIRRKGDFFNRIKEKNKYVSVLGIVINFIAI